MKEVTIEQLTDRLKEIGKTGEEIQEVISVAKERSETADAVYLNRRGTDRVTLHTDLPSAFPDNIRAGNLELDFEVQKGKGIEYVKNNFAYPHVLIQTINAKTGEYKVIS